MDTHQIAIRNCTGQLEPSLCRLLSLPKELRLEIWRYTVTDPSMSDVVLRIDREYSPFLIDKRTASKHCCNSLRQHTRFRAMVITTFEERRNCPINANLLQTNRLIYQEALPLLYHSIKFCPWNVSSIFPEFFSILSDFAKQHIRNIRLCIDKYIESRYHTSWAFLCAQVASLPCLRQVEVQSNCMQWPPSSRAKERLLRPLLRIQAPKKLVPDKNEEFQKSLAEAKEEMEVAKATRKERMECQAAECVEQRQHDVMQGHTYRDNDGARHFCLLPAADEKVAVSRHYTEDELRRGEREIEEWDLVSIESDESHLNDGLPEFVPDMERTRSRSDEESLFSNDSEWELIDTDSDYSDDKVTTELV